MDLLLLRKPKRPPQKPEHVITFTGLDAETKKVPKKDDSAGGSTLTPTNSVNFSNIDGLELGSLQGPTTSPYNLHEIRPTIPQIYEEPPLVNLLDLATTAPKQPPLFTLNDFVAEALASQTIGNNLQAPVKSRGKFESFHSTPNGMFRLLKQEFDHPPVLHVQDVIDEVNIPTAESKRVPKQQKLIEMRAVIREALQSSHSDSNQSLSFDSEGDTPNMIEDYPYPNTNALFCGGLSRFFQGEPRSNSPFCLSEEHDMTISKTVIFNTLREGGKKLSLRAHFISTVPDITPLSLTLVDLNLSFNNFRTIPIQVLHLPNLISLTLRNNPIIQLPSDMSGLPRLLELNLSFCLIHYLPEGFFTMPTVEDLNLSYNHLTEIPSSIVKLDNLQQLNLDGNQVSAMPFSTLGLTKLISLKIKNNFTSQKLWGEYSSKTPLSLKDTCAKLVVDMETNFRKYCNEELAEWIDRNVRTCECCGGNLLGEGLIITRSVMERNFGVRNLPFSLRSCSLSCFYEYKVMRNLDVAEGSQSSLHGRTFQQLVMLE